MMSKAELDVYRRENPNAAARADAERERVSALLVEFLDCQTTDLDAVAAPVRERISELVRELAAERCVDADGFVWRMTGRGRALLAWRSETQPT